ncbi:MAG: VOC family protein [Gemmatimonadota bacterium]|nr:VOC family protein [Gemmatimonadota bacterium]
MSILSLHHITIVCSSAQRTVDFYTRVLGLRLVKKTVNFDAPNTYHLYFGNEGAEPGSLVTFFEWPHASPGAPGIGGTHHYALHVADYDGLLMWKRRLVDLGVAVSGPARPALFHEPLHQGSGRNDCRDRDAWAGMDSR